MSSGPSAPSPRAAVLAAADDLFYRQGITAVTMAQIRDGAAVSLRRLYSLFPAKADLVTAWLENRHEAWTTMFESGIDHRLAEGNDAVDAVFGSLADWLVATDFRGCAFINALAETGVTTPAHRAVIALHKQSLIDLLARFTTEPAALAVLVDGAIVQSAVFASTDPVDAARRGAAVLFDI